MDSPYGYWYEAFELVARTLRPESWEAITATKAIRKAVLLPDEAVAAYIVQADHEAVTLTALTDRERVVRLHFRGESVRHIAVPLADVRYLGGEVTGLTSGMTEVWGFDALSYRFALGTAPESTELVLPDALPASLAGKEEIAFAQVLIAALTTR